MRNVFIAIGAVVFFLVLSYAFVPQVLDGKMLNQSDISGYVGMSHEMNEWNKAHPDDPAYWSGSMFSGMPTTTINSVTKGDWTQKIYNFLLTGRRPATYLFITLLGAFLLMLSLGIKWYVAIGGAIAVAFCSYNFQIIQVGHNTKMQAIAFLPWVLASLIFTYRKAITMKRFWFPSTLLGAVLFGLTVSFQVKANHQQITYYLALMILLYGFVLLCRVLFRHRESMSRFFVASLLLIVLGLVGVSANANKLLPLAKYTAHTMRGGTELSREGSTTGLDIDYATAWSYGWNELPNLMIPNYNGGSSSGAINPDKSETIRVLRQNGQTGLKDTAKHLPMYWGPQPFTAGPMYMGAITVFLFVLGLFLYRGKEKWWLLLTTVLAVFMGVGSHFMPFTRLCFDVLPLYNKFRTVSMALVMLQFTLPMLGFLVLDRILREKYPAEKYRRAAIVSAIITGGFCLLCWLLPDLFGDFRSAADGNYPDILSDAFAADRRMLFKKDAFASGIAILFSLMLILWSARARSAFAAKGRKVITVCAISMFVLTNMFVIGKRYLNADDFVTPKNFNSQFAARPVDKLILEDTDPSYRVMDLTVNVFNDSHPSYWHKNIGGYSPAKLQRYQDLIDHYIMPEYNAILASLRGAKTVGEVENALPDTPVLNALNCRYLIIGEDNAPVRNRRALGNAWFVEQVVPASTPDEEIALIGDTNLSHAAVIGDDFATDRTFAEDVVEFGVDSTDNIVLTYYSPNELRYHYDAKDDKVAVFSEVYYPEGWNATLDGNTKLSLFRADWILRAAVLPAGSHDIVMRFEPASYKTGERVSRASSIVLIILLLLSLGGIVGTGRI
ncbi:MAG: hypothetical protein IK143_02625 [Bacteroidales bacterium]|nr:hypothetical protein [Bacteroidales bacterium]